MRGEPSDYFVLSGGLQTNDKIWNTNNAPTINATVNEMVLGVSRNVNILNYTKTTTNPYGSVSSSFGFAWDQKT